MLLSRLQPVRGGWEGVGPNFGLVIGLRGEPPEGASPDVALAAVLAPHEHRDTEPVGEANQFVGLEPRMVAVGESAHQSLAVSAAVAGSGNSSGWSCITFTGGSRRARIRGSTIQ